MSDEAMSAGPEVPPEPERSRVPPRRAWMLAILVALAYLAVTVPLLGDYGATWDTSMMDFPYGERLLEYLHTGDPVFLDLEKVEPHPPVRAPHPDFDAARGPSVHTYPLAALLSAVSCRVLWTELGLVPALAAHDLVVLLFAAALLLALVRFAVPRIGALAAVGAAVLLAGCPRFFADAFNNLRDVPVASLYVTATLLGFVALTRGGLRWWIASGAVTGLALAAKANALFVPPQLALFLVCVSFVPGLRRLGSVRWSWKGFALGALAVVLANFLATPDYWTAPIHGPARRISEIMHLGNAWLDPRVTADTPTLAEYAPLMVLTTTPPVVLVLAAVGLFSRRLSAPLRAFLVSALVLTLGRNMLPGARNHNGVRHFLEFFPYLCLAAGAGLATIAELLVERVPSTAGRVARVVLVGGCLLAPAWQAARTHPNGVAYFNSFVGGLAGAQELGIPTATDYWGNSFWQAFAWLDEHAEQGAAVIVPEAAHVAATIAPVRLRPDLALWRRAPEGRRPIAYVVYGTRTDIHGPLMAELVARSRPVHEIRVQGGVILRIFRLDRDAFGDEMIALWKRMQDSASTTGRIVDWLTANPAEGRRALQIVQQVDQLGIEETARRLREILPESLHVGLEDTLWTLENR